MGRWLSGPRWSRWGARWSRGGRDSLDGGRDSLDEARDRLAGGERLSTRSYLALTVAIAGAALSTGKRYRASALPRYARAIPTTPRSSSHPITGATSGIRSSGIST